MKTIHQLPAYINKELKAFEKGIDKIGPCFDKEDVHQLRVDIKKIRAMYRLVEAVFPGQFDAKKESRLFKKIFKHAGHVREAQNNRERIGAYSVPGTALKDYKKMLDEEEKEGRQALKKHIKRFDNTELKKQKQSLDKLMKGLTQGKLKNGIDGFVADERAKIKEFNTHVLSKAALHGVRKRLKEIGIVANFLYKVHNTNSMKEFITELNSTEELIGEWHDKVILKTSVQNFMKNNKDVTGQNKTAMNKVIIQLSSHTREQNKRLKQKINSSLHLRG